MNHFLTSGLYEGLGGSTYDGRAIIDSNEEAQATHRKSASNQPYWQPRPQYCPTEDGCAPGAIKGTKNCDMRAEPAS